MAGGVEPPEDSLEGTPTSWAPAWLGEQAVWAPARVLAESEVRGGAVPEATSEAPAPLYLSRVPISSGPPDECPSPIQPEPFVGKHEGRLGRPVGVTQFGVNHTTLDLGSVSSLRHGHEREDEFIHYPDDDPGPIRT